MPPPSSHDETFAAAFGGPHGSPRRIKLALFWLGVLLFLGCIVGAKAWLRNRFQTEMAALNQKWSAQIMPLNQRASKIFSKLSFGGSIDEARKELLKIGPRVVESHSLPTETDFTILQATDPETGFRVELRFVGNSVSSMSYGISGGLSFDNRPWKYFATGCAWITGMATFAWIVLIIATTVVSDKGPLLHGLIALALAVMIIGSLDSSPGGVVLSLSAIRFAWTGVAFLLASLFMALRWRKKRQQPLALPKMPLRPDRQSKRHLPRMRHTHQKASIFPRRNRPAPKRNAAADPRPITKHPPSSLDLPSTILDLPPSLATS